MLGYVVDLVFSLFTGLLSILPASFVRSYIDGMDAIQYLGYVNYFIPFGVLFSIGQKWLICCGLYLIFHFSSGVYHEVKKK